MESVLRGGSGDALGWGRGLGNLYPGEIFCIVLRIVEVVIIELVAVLFSGINAQILLYSI